MLITTLAVSFCKDGGGSVSVKLWFLVVYVRCEVLCRVVVTGNVFLLIHVLIAFIYCISGLIYFENCSSPLGLSVLPPTNTDSLDSSLLTYFLWNYKVGILDVM